MHSLSTQIGITCLAPKHYLGLCFNSPKEANAFAQKARQFSCALCELKFRSQSEIKRHRLAVHDKQRPFLCHEPGCNRNTKGFSRKDNFEVHVRNVHSVQPGDAGQSGKGGQLHPPSRTPKREHEMEDELRSRSRKDLIKVVLEERENCRIERRRREELEEELKNAKRRHEEREDMWLKILTTKN